MLSGFNRSLMSLTIVSPLLLSFAIVVITRSPSDYFSGWSILLAGLQVPDFTWWMVHLFILVFCITLFVTRSILCRKANRKDEAKSISLSSLQPKTFNVWQVVAMLAPWITVIYKGDDVPVNTILIIAGVIALVTCIYFFNLGYNSLIFTLLGYTCYDGKNRNNMPITLLSKRHWRNAADVREIVELTPEMALII